MIGNIFIYRLENDVNLELSINQLNYLIDYANQLDSANNLLWLPRMKDLDIILLPSSKRLS